MLSPRTLLGLHPVIGSRYRPRHGAPVSKSWLRNRKATSAKIRARLFYFIAAGVTRTPVPMKYHPTDEICTYSLAHILRYIPSRHEEITHRITHTL